MSAQCTFSSHRPQARSHSHSPHNFSAPTGLASWASTKANQLKTHIYIWICGYKNYISGGYWLLLPHCSWEYACLCLFIEMENTMFSLSWAVALELILELRAAGQYRCDVRERIKSFERLFEMNDMIRFTVGSRSFLMNSGGKSTQFQRSSSLQIAINPISAGQAVSCLSLYSSEWRGLRYGGWDHLIQRFQTVLKKTTWPTVSYCIILL